LINARPDAGNLVSTPEIPASGPRKICTGCPIEYDILSFDGMFDANFVPFINQPSAEEQSSRYTKRIKSYTLRLRDMIPVALARSRLPDRVDNRTKKADVVKHP
jgi:hypothetical protein